MLVRVIQFTSLLRVCAAVEAKWTPPSLDFVFPFVLNASRKEYKLAVRLS